MESCLKTAPRSRFSHPCRRRSIALAFHAIDAQKASPTLRIRALTHTNGHWRARRSGLGKVHPRLHIACALAQVVEVGDGDVGQGGEFALPVYRDGPFGELLGGRIDKVSWARSISIRQRSAAGPLRLAKGILGGPRRSLRRRVSRCCEIRRLTCARE